MQYILEHFGVGVAAITGVLAARGKGVDLFGVIVLAVVTAFGGGTLRDLLVGDTPVFWVRDPIFLLNATGVAVAAFFAARVREFPQSVLLVADAFALALFTTIGVKKALLFDVAPAIAIAMGVITGVAGGIIRDMLAGEIPLVFRPAIYLYATAALCGAVTFVVLNRWSQAEQMNMVLASGVTLLLRLAAIRWKLHLPVFRHRAERLRAYLRFPALHSRICRRRQLRLQSGVSPNCCNHPGMRFWAVLLLMGGLLAPWMGRAQTFGGAVQVGNLSSFEITEASGIVASRQNPNVLWTHNDTGFGGSIFAISTNGTPLGRWFVPTAFFGNFEDIAIGPGPNPEHQYVYLGDIGDNAASRSSIRVFRFPEPAVYPYFSNSPPVLPLVGVQEIQMAYPDGVFDAEAMMVDPWTGDLFIATKQTNSARLYRATRAELDGGGPIELTFIREMSFGGFRSVGAADISFDGRLICMRRNGRVWTWNRALNQTVGAALAASGSQQSFATNEVNGEAIGFHATGLGYYTTAEGFQPPLNYFRRTDASLPVQPVVFIRPGEDWRYQDTGVDEGTAWRGMTFDDSAWSSGPAQLGYGQGDEQMVVSFGFDDFEKNVTTYFRRQFTRPAAVTNLSLQLCFTDGVAVYLNGTEIFRRNLATNAAYDALATGSNRAKQNFWTAVPVLPSLLRAGTNILAVELHREDRQQTDLSFDLQLVQGTVNLPVRFTGSPQVFGGSWRIGLAGPPGALATLELSNDLALWSVAGQLVLTNGTGQYLESVQSGNQPRFFRVKKE